MTVTEAPRRLLTAGGAAAALGELQNWLPKQRRRSRKQRKNQIHLEYENLKSLIPQLSVRKHVSKVDIVNEAVRYIDQLQQQVIEKLAGQGGLLQLDLLDLPVALQ